MLMVDLISFSALNHTNEMVFSYPEKDLGGTEMTEERETCKRCIDTIVLHPLLERLHALWFREFSL